MKVEPDPGRAGVLVGDMKSRRAKFPSLDGRPEVLTRQRNLKMARSAHAYVRGNTAQFYAWLESEQGLAVPQGPAIWICGDCHVGNLGPIANARGRVDVQIRDLDQTVIGNPAHDLIRLGLSLASAARGSDLPGAATALMIERMTEGYEQAFIDLEEGTENEAAQPEVVKRAMRQALRRKWRHLARERIEDESPRIPLGSRFWPLTDEERAGLDRLFEHEEVRRLVTSLRSRENEAPLEVLDAAYWMKGCSSLGKLRYAVLLGVGGRGGSLCLMDVKEAIQTVAPCHPEAGMPEDDAERVVAGARHLSPSLGERMLATRLGDHSIFLRELLPQDLKFEIERLSLKEAVRVAEFLAAVTGKAHARQMDQATRRAWREELSRPRTKQLGAPSWLWSSVVSLMAMHEGAYLEHCRRHALPVHDGRENR